MVKAKQTAGLATLLTHFVLIAVLLITVAGCENKPINEGFRAKEIHEKIDFHFDRVVVDGVEYLILERDTNNPHEGFGFMALRANSLLRKQDSILAYVQTIADLEMRTYAHVLNISEDEARLIRDDIFQSYLDKSMGDMKELEKESLMSVSMDSGSSSPEDN